MGRWSASIKVNGWCEIISYSSGAWVATSSEFDGGFHKYSPDEVEHITLEGETWHNTRG